MDLIFHVKTIEAYGGIVKIMDALFTDTSGQ